MAIKTFKLEQPAHNNSRPRLDNFLAQSLPQKIGEPLSKSVIRKLIVAGAVYLNGQRVRIASKPVFPGAKVEIHIDWNKIKSPNAFDERAYAIKKEDVLFEDDDLIVVNKPSGLATQPTLDRARNNLYTAVKQYLRATRGDDYSGLHHRIDKDTSGLVLFTKSTRANAPVADLFKNHKIQKTYIAVVGHPQNLKADKFRIENFLKKDPASPKKMGRFMSVLSGGDHAITDIEVITRNKSYAVLHAKPLTGRTHQIRVHLSEFGCPIYGDFLYGESFVKSAERLMLHAYELEFTHPLTKELLQIVAPPPADIQRFLSLKGDIGFD